MPMDLRLNKKGDVPGWAYVVGLVLGLIFIIILGVIIAKSAGVQVDILKGIW